MLPISVAVAAANVDNRFDRNKVVLLWSKSWTSLKTSLKLIEKMGFDVVQFLPQKVCYCLGFDPGKVESESFALSVIKNIVCDGF